MNDEDPLNPLEALDIRYELTVALNAFLGWGSASDAVAGNGDVFVFKPGRNEAEGYRVAFGDPERFPSIEIIRAIGEDLPEPMRKPYEWAAIHADEDPDENDLPLAFIRQDRATPHEIFLRYRGCLFVLTFWWKRRDMPIMSEPDE
jgi:hypothetical protein